MSEINYNNLDDFVYYGSTEKNIKQFDWFDSFPFTNKKQLCYILRTPVDEDIIRQFLMDVFPKIFSVNLQLVNESEDKPWRIYTYLITLILHYENFWDDVVDKLFLYSMSIINCMDFHTMVGGKMHFASLVDNLGVFLEAKAVIIPEKFFNREMANFINSLKTLKDIGKIPLWGSLSRDIEAINFLLSSPQNMKNVLLKVPVMDCTEISKLISDEYNYIRRTL